MRHFLNRRRPIFAFALLTLGWSASPALSANLHTAAMIDGAVEGFIRPGYQALHASTGALKSSVDEMCAAPSPAALDAARTSFGKTVGAWSEIELVRIGPVTEEHRLERFLHWPDRRGLGLKQVQEAIAEQDTSVTDTAKLAEKSVAMQGLGALEYVLFGTESEGLATGDAFRCSYGAAISGYLDMIADTIEEGWEGPGGFADFWAKPSPDNPFYRTDSEALTDLLEVFVNGLEVVRAQRVNFLGEIPKTDKPKQALFWRSNSTVTALGGNMAGMKAMFDASGLTEALPENSRWIAQSINFEFGNAMRAAEGATGPIDEVLADRERRSKLTYFKLVTRSLSDLFGKRLSSELGLTVGFSSLDGD